MDFSVYNDLISIVKNNMTDNVSKLIGAGIFLLIGIIACKFIRKMCIKALSKTNIDKGVSNFIKKSKEDPFYNLGVAKFRRG